MATLFSPSLGQAAIDHGPWSVLLARHVDDQGRVAYRDLQGKDRALFDAYLLTLAQTQTDGMAEDEEKSLWLNAYNAAIVSGVLQGYTAEGVLGRKRLFGWFTVEVAGKARTPDEIEHHILRKKFHDPRIHFALVCASSSCPKLRREAYDPEHLEAQLDAATRDFLADLGRNHIEANQVALSRIFEWYAADFAERDGSVVAFIRRFVGQEKQVMLPATDGELRYLDYNWTLNAQDGQRVR